MHATMNGIHGGSRRNGSPTMNSAAWAVAIVRLDVQERARVLGRLLGLVGPLALAVLGDGAFAKYLRFARQAFVPVTVEDAGRATLSQIQEVLRYVRQSHPEIRPRGGFELQTCGGISC
jgi:hypothetical protein